MLANLMFFWDAWPEGEGGGSDSDTITAYVGAGGGQARDEDFWEVREAYLKRIHNVVEEMDHEAAASEAPGLQPVALAGNEDQGPAAEIARKRAAAFRAAEVATTKQELQAQAELIASLTMQLAEQRARDEEDMLFILLLLS